MPPLSPSPADRRRPQGWADPNLLVGRGLAGTVLVALMILIGSFTDTIAFKSTLDLLLRAPEWQSWAMAIGATLLALVAAGNLGATLTASRRRDPDASRPQMVASALTWLGLGAALVYVRWTSADVPAVLSGFTGVTSTQVQQLHQAHASAFFFGALYLISGLGTALEVARRTNPAARALRRGDAACARQERIVDLLVGEATRARHAMDHHGGEFDRDLARRDSARADRQALGAEAANYARVLMAQLMHDPRRTGVTDTGPLPLPAAGEGQDDDQPRPGWTA